jgi:hypothetical protein
MAYRQARHTARRPTAARRILWLLLTAPACFDPSFRPTTPADAGLLGDTAIDAAVMMDTAETDVAMMPDAPSDATIDAAPTSCLARWHDHALVISEPGELASLSTSAGERDPWLSSDGLRIYYERRPSGQESDIYLASRSDPSQPFQDPQPISSVNWTGRDSGPALAAGETMLALYSTRDSGRFQLYLATRSSISDDFSMPTMAHLNNINNVGQGLFDPFLSQDGKRLYLTVLTSDRRYLAVATRDSVDADFPPAIELTGLAELGHEDADPALSPDETLIVFTSKRPGGPAEFNLWYATRADAQSNFGPPRLVPGVNSDLEDIDPALSADGCELVFASPRRPGGGSHRLYAATIMR